MKRKRQVYILKVDRIQPFPVSLRAVILIKARSNELRALAVAQVVRWTGLSEKAYFALVTYIWPPYPPPTFSRNDLRHENDKMKFDKFRPLALITRIARLSHAEGFPKSGHILWPINVYNYMSLYNVMSTMCDLFGKT